MDDLVRAIVNAKSVIGTELPKFFDEPQAAEFVGTLKALVPQDFTDLGLMLMTGGYGKAAKLGGAALAASSYSGDANAGYVPTLAKAMREFPWAKALPDNVVQMIRALRKESAATGNEAFYSGMGSKIHTSGSPTSVNLPADLVRNMQVQKPAIQAHTHPATQYKNDIVPSNADLQLNQATPSTAGLIVTPQANPQFALYGAKGVRPFKADELLKYSDWVASHANDNRALDWAEEVGMTNAKLKNPYAPFQAWVQNTAPLTALRDLEARGRGTALYNPGHVLLPDTGQSVPSGALIDEFYNQVLR